MIEPLLAGREQLARGVFAGTAVDARLEVPTVSGVPDVLLVEWDEEVVAERIQIGLGPVVDLTMLRVLGHLNAGPTSVLTLSPPAGVTTAHLRRSVLPQLKALGWIRVTDSGEVALADAVRYRAPVSALITIEAKLNSWRRAFHQAARHALSADAAFIALDARHAAAGLRYAEEMAAAGVGVVTVDAATRNVSVITRPVTSNPRGAEYMLVAERAWSLRCQGRRSGETYPVFGRDLAAARFSR